MEINSKTKPARRMIVPMTTKKLVIISLPPDTFTRNTATLCKTKSIKKVTNIGNDNKPFLSTRNRSWIFSEMSKSLSFINIFISGSFRNHIRQKRNKIVSNNLFGNTNWSVVIDSILDFNKSLTDSISRFLNASIYLLDSMKIDDSTLSNQFFIAVILNKAIEPEAIQKPVIARISAKRSIILECIIPK